MRVAFIRLDKTTVIFTATDGCGNFSLCSFIVTVDDLNCIPQPCDSCANNIVLNPDFSDGFNPDGSDWTTPTGSPQLVSDNCGTPGSYQMWGNQNVGEAIEQSSTSGFLFEAGKTYRIRFCGRYLLQPNLNNPSVQFGFTASNGSVNPFTAGYNIGLSNPITSQAWTCYTLPDWTAPTDFSTLTINATNNVPDNGTPFTVSWGRIDNICIEEVVPPCKPQFAWLADSCGMVQFTKFILGDQFNLRLGLWRWNTNNQYSESITHLWSKWNLHRLFDHKW